MTMKRSHQLWLFASLVVRKLKEFADKVSTLILKNPPSSVLFVLASKDTN
jgi:hypothetical protein